MSKIDYTWHSETPERPDVYTTRRGESKYQTLRYWDGFRWWQIDWLRRRTAKAFVWPKKSRTRFPSGMSHYRGTLGLRRINDPFQRHIHWGEPFKVFDRDEVLKHLVKTSRLLANWETCYQAEMRDADQKGLL